MLIQHFSSIINSYLPEPEASLLKGITYGVSIPSSLNLYNQMKRVGISHIAVFSGANISIALGSFSFIRAYIGNKLYIVIAILFIILVLLMVGIKAPVMRASVFSLSTYVALLLGRRKSTFYLTFLSLLILLSIKPFWLYSISFQLSYASTIGVMLATSHSKPEGDSHGLLLYLKDEFNISVAALLATLPIVLYNFHQIPIISPFSNILIAFTICPILILGLLTGILGNINPLFGILPAYLAYPFLSISF